MLEQQRYRQQGVRVEAVATDKALRRATSSTDRAYEISYQFNADIVLVDPDSSVTVSADQSESAQGYSPFEGLELHGKVRCTYLRGHLVYQDGNIVGTPRGRYLKRPC